MPNKRLADTLSLLTIASQILSKQARFQSKNVTEYINTCSLIAKTPTTTLNPTRYTNDTHNNTPVDRVYEPTSPISSNSSQSQPTSQQDRTTIPIQNVNESITSPTPNSTTTTIDNTPSPRPLQSSRVPSNRLSRLFHYTHLITSVGISGVSQSIKQKITSNNELNSNSASTSSVWLSQKNLEKIVNKLTKMRGAALKLGQMLSIQDNVMLPPELEQILLKVQNSANYMPDSQMQQMLRKELGPDWESSFNSFSLVPFAAASIGQVHNATIQHSNRETRVAVKIQYPGVADSIYSDLQNLKMLLLFSGVLPKGLYLDNTIKVAQKELAWEVDYEREYQNMETMRQKLIDAGEYGVGKFMIPEVIPELSTKKVLTTTFVNGLPIGSLSHLPQHIRDSIGTRMLRLVLRELFQHGFMQTDPNWSNFLYEPETDTIHLLDFGSARPFPPEFLANYLRILIGAFHNNAEAIKTYSTKCGFLTGYEIEDMVKAHTISVLTLGKPFRTPGLFHFGSQDINGNSQDITDQVRDLIPTMLKYRLTPPPDETYSLHRKLSGVFLLCARLKARVYCEREFVQAMEVYEKMGGDIRV